MVFVRTKQSFEMETHDTWKFVSNAFHMAENYPLCSAGLNPVAALRQGCIMLQSTSSEQSPCPSPAAPLVLRFPPAQGHGLSCLNEDAGLQHHSTTQRISFKDSRGARDLPWMQLCAWRCVCIQLWGLVVYPLVYRGGGVGAVCAGAAW